MWGEVTRPHVSLLVFALLLLPYAYFNYPEGWNQLSRLAELHAIVNKGSVSIDAYHDLTGDKALVDGHYYSEKAPAIAVLALPVFSATVMVQRAFGIDPDRQNGWHVSEWITTVGSVGTIAALGGVAFFWLLARSMSAESALVGTAAVFLGTLVWPYATALFAHAGTVGLLSIALALILDVEQADYKRQAIAGLCAGLAVASEYPAVIGAAALAVLALRAGPAVAFRFCVAALPAALLIMTKNYLVTGSPWMVSYGSNPEFPGETPAANFGHHWPTLESLHGVLFSEYRGLFFWSPVLLMAIPGLMYLSRTAPFVAACVAGAIILQVMQAAGFYRWWGGNAVGARYMSPAIPFLGYAAAHGIKWFPKIGTTLAAVSVGLMAMVVAIDIAPIEDIKRPLMDLYLPRLQAGEFAPNLGTALGLPPLTSVDLIAIVSLLIGAEIWRRTVAESAGRVDRSEPPAASPPASPNNWPGPARDV